MRFKGFLSGLLQIRNTRSSLMMRVALAAIIIIPVLYAGMFLWAFMDPYARLNTIPVAIVNEDAGATINGEQRIIGNELCDQLAETSNGFQWNFVSAAEAQNGMENSTYYMTCTIPSNFSADLASAENADCQQAQLDISYNESANMIAGTIGTSVWREVKDELTAKISKTYLETIFNKVNDGASQLESAVDGVSTLQDGLSDMRDGNAQVTNGATTLAQGTQSLADSVPTLTSGVNELSTGASNLSNGAQTYVSGVTAVLDGTATLDTGANTLAASLAASSPGITQLVSGSQDAQTGAASLATGLATANAYLGTTSDSSTLIGGSYLMASGLYALKNGTSTTSGLLAAEAGAQKLTTGLTSLKGGVTQAKEGATTISAGLSSAVATLSDTGKPSSVASLLAAARTAYDKGDIATGDTYMGYAVSTLNGVSSGLESIKTGADTLQTGLAGAEASLGTSSDSSTLIGGSVAIATGLATANAYLGSPSDSSTLIGGANTIANGLYALKNGTPGSSGLLTAQNGAEELAGSQGLTALTTGLKTLQSGLSAASAGAAQIATGLDTIQTNKYALMTGGASLAAGSTQLASGTKTLATGTETLATGATALNDGTQTLATGSASLDNYYQQALDGLHDLGDGLSDAVSSMSMSTDEVNNRADMMSEPVVVSSSYFTTVANYGTGFAPFFMSIALWVGAIVISFLFKPLNKRLIVSGESPFAAAFAGWLPAAFAGVIQAVLTMLVLQLALNIQIDHMIGFYLFGILMPLCFAAILQFFSAAFGLPGKVICIIILMLQLTSAGGTFPLETTPLFFQAISPWLPMTYMVNAMRILTTGVDMMLVWRDVIIVVGMTAGAFFLTCLVARSRRTIKMETLHPILDLD